MYKKIWGLKQLGKMDFPIPPYEVIDITKDRPADLRGYLLSKIEKVGLPCELGDRVGVTIRVSMPGTLDKIATHGGLHIEKDEVLKRVIEKIQQYGPKSKIIVQHTVDALCSGAALKENDHAIIETVFGDAPPLLEGKTDNYEKWVLNLTTSEWKNERIYLLNGKKINVLSSECLATFAKLIRKLPGSSYVEWSLSKNSKLYFYEYCQLKS